MKMPFFELEFNCFLFTFYIALLFTFDSKDWETEYKVVTITKLTKHFWILTHLILLAIIAGQIIGYYIKDFILDNVHFNLLWN